MTHNRETLSEALQFNRVDDTEYEFIVREAARERLAQLPERCNECVAGYVDPRNSVATCRNCKGYAWVYPAETVDRIARAFLSSVWPDPIPPKLLAIAALEALAALNEEHAG